MQRKVAMFVQRDTGMSKEGLNFEAKLFVRTWI